MPVHRNGAYSIVMRGVQKCTCSGASLRGRNSAQLCCIKLDTATDEGISGTSTKRREGFNRMVDDALAGKINLILTKSVSRFARNTVDSLTTIRKPVRAKCRT